MILYVRYTYMSYCVDENRNFFYYFLIRCRVTRVFVILCSERRAHAVVVVAYNIIHTLMGYVRKYVQVTTTECPSAGGAVRSTVAQDEFGLQVVTRKTRTVAGYYARTSAVVIVGYIGSWCVSVSLHIYLYTHTRAHTIQ